MDIMYVRSMNEDQRASSSTDSEEKPRPDEEDSKDLLQHGSSSSAEETWSSSDELSARWMKRSQGFNCSFSFEEDPQTQSQRGVQAQSQRGVQPQAQSQGGVQPQAQSQRGVQPQAQSQRGVQAQSQGGVQPQAQSQRGVQTQAPQRGAVQSCPQGQEGCETLSQRPGLFRPQDIWLAVTRCLSIRWRPCLSLNRLDRNNRKLAYQKDCEQSQKSFSSDSLESVNQSSSTISTSSEDFSVTLVKKEEEEAKSREVKRGPQSCWGVSRSSPRLPRDRQVSNVLLASMILERDMCLTVELIDRGEEEQELRYQAEWKLTERSRELAAGLWLSRTLMD